MSGRAQRWWKHLSAWCGVAQERSKVEGTFLAEGTRALQHVRGGDCCKDALLGCLCWSGEAESAGCDFSPHCAHVKQDLGGRGGGGASLGDICSVLSWAVVCGLPCQYPGARPCWVMSLAKSRTCGEHQRMDVRFGPVCTGLQSKSLCLGVT